MVVRPSNQTRSVDGDLRVDEFGPEVLRAREHVGGGADFRFQSIVGVADHQGVEARSGHHGERVAVHPTEVDPALRSRCRRRCRHRDPAGIPRFEASRLPVPSGTMPSAVSVPASGSRQARTVPSPPQATTMSAPFSTASLRLAGPGIVLSRRDELHARRRARLAGRTRPGRCRWPGFQMATVPLTSAPRSSPSVDATPMHAAVGGGVGRRTEDRWAQDRGSRPLRARCRRSRH